MNRKTLTLAAALTVGALGLSIAGAGQALADVKAEVAHRGLTTSAVEGTPQAMTDAIKAGYAGIEFDVRLTKDSRAVVLHDTTMDRTTDCVGPVAKVTLTAAQKCGLTSLEDMIKSVEKSGLKYKWSGLVFVHVKVTLSSGTASGLVNRMKPLTNETGRAIFMLEDPKNQPRLKAAGWKGRQGLMIHTAADWKLVLDPNGPFKVGVTYDATGTTPGYDAVITSERAAAMAKLKRTLWAIVDAPQSAEELAALPITGLFV